MPRRLFGLGDNIGRLEASFREHTCKNLVRQLGLCDEEGTSGGGRPLRPNSDLKVVPVWYNKRVYISFFTPFGMIGRLFTAFTAV